MIRKTEGIVLRTFKHQDSNLIARVFTRESGLQTFLIPGHRSSKSRARHSFFQPLSIIELVYQERPNRDIQKPQESKLARNLFQIQSHPVKLSLGLAMLELFGDTVGEEEDPAHYDFLHDLILRLDEAEEKLIQLFLHFLVHHTRFLGFFPHDDSGGAANVSFDLSEGTLRPDATGSKGAALIRAFVHSHLGEGEGNCQQIRVINEDKRDMIRLLFDYYRMHVTGFRYPQTMRVFAEVFGD